MLGLARTIKERVPGVSYATRLWFETEVRFILEYDAAICDVSGRLATSGTGATGSSAWGARPNREGLAATARQSRISNTVGEPDASASGQQESAPAAADTGGSRGAGSRGVAGVHERRPVEGGRVSLRHFSRREGLTFDDPGAFGIGAANRNELNEKGGKYWVYGSYYCIATGEPGGDFKEDVVGDVAYEASIGESDLYDVAAHPDGLRAKAIAAAREAGYNDEGQCQACCQEAATMAARTKDIMQRRIDNAVKRAEAEHGREGRVLPGHERARDF
jgi:hypothetical protein